jgi:uncharacterized protein (DUF2252 family)
VVASNEVTESAEAGTRRRTRTTQAVAHATVEERAARGKAARKLVPRESHAYWEPTAERPDPVGLLIQQETTRVPELIPIRHQRMLVSPFTFYRGTAIVMATDLATTPTTGIKVQLCGDAHLSNFGGFAAPDRQLIFDLNDFDETLPGPWEWDVKRLAASFAVAADARGMTGKKRREVVLASVAAYRNSMRSFATMGNLDVWYSRLDMSWIQERVNNASRSQATRAIDQAVAKASAKDSMRAFSKLTARVDGKLRIKGDPPLIVPVEDVAEGVPPEVIEQTIRGYVRSYRKSLQRDRRKLLESFTYHHMARKVVGVGSVGTRCWIVLLTGRTEDDPLFLQVKEAGPSVLEDALGRSEYANSGQRVVEGQRMMQAASDIFLGWDRVAGIDGTQRDFYFRQLWDWKFSIDFETMRSEFVIPYAQMCGWTLARAHARSGDRVAIAAYLGQSTKFDQAVTAFAEAYADQNDRDYAAMMEAASSGRIEVAPAPR